MLARGGSCGMSLSRLSVKDASRRICPASICGRISCISPMPRSSVPLSTLIIWSPPPSWLAMAARAPIMRFNFSIAMRSSEAGLAAPHFCRPGLALACAIASASVCERRGRAGEDHRRIEEHVRPPAQGLVAVLDLLTAARSGCRSASSRRRSSRRAAPSPLSTRRARRCRRGCSRPRRSTPIFGPRCLRHDAQEDVAAAAGARMRDQGHSLVTG